MIRLAFPALVLCTGMALGQAPQPPLLKVEQITFPELQQIMHRDSGKAVLVNVWATWCKPCREEMPALLRLKKSLPEKKFTLILVSADDADDLERDVRPMLKKLGVDFTTYIVKDSYEPFIMGMMPQWKGALALPMTFVYDTKGALADWMVGGKEYQVFKEAVTKVTAK
jgi:thiol-disulfide isomerase/thioredoxin